MDFKGKVALVTGAAAGIGRATALKLGSLGADLAIADLNEQGLLETRREAEALGCRVFAQTLDVSQRQTCFDFVANVKAGDATFKPALAHFGTAQTQELTLITGYYMMVCRFLETFEVDIESGGAAGLNMDAERIQ